MAVASAAGRRGGVNASSKVRAPHLVAAMPEAQKVLLAAGLEPAPNSPSEMRRIVEADYKKWGELIKALGLKVE